MPVFQANYFHLKGSIEKKIVQVTIKKKTSKTI